MKGKLLSLAAASLICGSVAEAKFYLGIEGGYNGSVSEFSYEDKVTSTSFSKKLKEQGVVGNLVLGTEHFFGSQHFGLRWGIFGGYGSAWGDFEGTKTRLDTISFGGSFDLFGNFVAKENLMSGIFVGIEYDYTLLNPKDEIVLGKNYSIKNGMCTPEWSQNAKYSVSNKTASNSLAVRVGLSTRVAKHHRFEVMAKIPVMLSENTSHYDYTYTFNGQLKDKVDDTFKFTYKYIQGLVSYKYVF